MLEMRFEEVELLKGKASPFVDGITIAEPEDFDDQIDIHADSLVAASHGLGVRAVGKPGGHVEIEVRQLASGGGSVRLQNVASDHPLLTSNGDGHHDTTVLQALTTPLVPPTLKWTFQYHDLTRFRGGSCPFKTRETL